MHGVGVGNVTRNTRKKKRKTTNVVDAGQKSIGNSDAPARPFKHLSIKINSDDVERSLYQSILEIHTHQLKKQHLGAQLVGSEIPVWPPCPPYRQRFRGIVNLQNTCYLLSCIQALFSLPPFVAVLDHISVGLHSLFDDVGSLQTHLTEEIATGTPLLRLFLLLLDEISFYKPNQPQEGIRQIPTDYGYIQTGKPLKLNPKFFEILTFEQGVEQDAADCMSRLVTQLHEEMATLFRKFKQPEKTAIPWWELDAQQQEADDDGWTTVVAQGKKLPAARETPGDNGDTTPISIIFGGDLISRSSYAKTSRTANKSDICVKERFFIIPLEINNPEVRQLEDGFRLLSKGETLSDFKDPETGTCVVMSRRMFVDHLPPVLMVQLNRFYHTNTGQFMIQKSLKQFPIYKKLVISDEVVSKERSFSKAQGTYELHAVVFHHGYGVERGHYTTAVNLPNVDGEGYGEDLIYFDDQSVFRLDQREPEGELMFNSHRPFDGRSCHFLEPCLGAMQRNKSNQTHHESIHEQPRTPYILVYVSTFRQ